MESFEQYLNEIRQNSGIRRLPMDPNYGATLDAAVRTFIGVANAMLDWKGIRYDFESMKPYVFQLMAWTLLTEDNYCPTKGFLYKGATGKGKTFMLQVYSNWLKAFKCYYISNGIRMPMQLEVVSARRIAAEYTDEQSGGAAVITKYAEKPFLCIDDIAAESMMQNNFGNKVSVVNEILDRRYEKNLITFATTNLDKMTKEDGFDDRMRRRIMALFNIVTIKPDKNF